MFIILYADRFSAFCIHLIFILVLKRLMFRIDLQNVLCCEANTTTTVIRR